MSEVLERIKVSPEIERLKASRDLAAMDFYWFTRQMFHARRPGQIWQRAPHHRVVCDALTAVYKGEITRLILNIPPRYSKTELAVINFMAWCLGKNPDSEFIHTSYAADLASNNAWQARDIVQNEEYQRLFPNVALDQTSQAMDHWKTTAGGVVYATGMEGTIIGFGAGKMRPGFGGAIIIDDPHKAADITSDVKRMKVIRNFQSTLESRRNSRLTPIILMMQRLHEEDLAGWLLAGGNGEKWTLIEMPALREDGTALWPEKHSRDDLLLMQEKSPWTFSSQFQQQPIPVGGGFIKPDKIVIEEAEPKIVRQWVRAWDLAGTVGDGDWTVGALMGQTRDNKHFIKDMVRLRGSPDQVEAAILRTAVVDGKRVRVSLPQDPGQAGKHQVAYLTRQLSGYSVVSSPETGDKTTRAEPFAAQVNVGNVAMLKADWNLAYINELKNFPLGAHDDQVDASSRGFAELNDGSTYDSSLSWVA